MNKYIIFFEKVEKTTLLIVAKKCPQLINTFI